MRYPLILAAVMVTLLLISFAVRGIADGAGWLK